MKYDAMPILCRKCLDVNVPQAELIRYLDNYVASLPDTIRVNDDVYRERLSFCSECIHLNNATCALCGCYAQARAAKRNQRCPIAGNPKWTEIPIETECD